ncbi:MAG: trypsin-like peptidase domain-containing protein [Oscillospiraceae bacterium]|nr:trypsin-like peptidase domain-containing protein [Oscillospiraceae bacterium]
MYEDNNYTYTSNYSPEPEPKKSGGAAKTAAVILAAVLAGGASGFGGAYLANNMSADDSVPADSVSASYDDTEESRETIQTVTTAPQSNNDDGDTPLGNLLNIDSSNSDNISDEEVIRRATPSVTLITSVFPQSGKGTGTGIVLSSDGYIITNWHVIETSYETYQSSGGNPFDNPFSFFGGGYDIVTKTEKASEVTVTLSDGSEHKATVVGSDENTDLALLKIDADGLIPAVLGNSDDLKLGEKALTLGYPLGLGLSASGGMVSGLDKEINSELSNGKTVTMTLIQTDASINPGNSGGPLLNSKGEVIGITSSKIASSSIEGIGFAIPISDAIPILDSLMTKGYVATPKLGISGTTINSAAKRYYNLPVNSGVLVASVEEGSCADIAGIEEGDVIIAADGKDIDDFDALVAAKNSHQPGDTMTVTLARSDGNIDLEIILDEAPKDE